MPFPCRAFLLILLAAFALTIHAEPVITSIAPSSGPTIGGTVVTITGTGFQDGCIICSPPLPPVVLFGGTPARSVSRADETTITVVTPAHFPATTDVTVAQWDGRATVSSAFTFHGTIADGFEALLLPVYTPPVQGAFGSEFRTALNGWSTAPPRTHLYGLEQDCIILCIPTDPLEVPIVLDHESELTGVPLLQNGNPGRILWVDKTLAPNLSLFLRAFDVSREATNFGTQIPIPRGADFKEEIALLDVPLDARFRKTLRIYGLDPTPIIVYVTIGDEPAREVVLRAGEAPFVPAYAEIGNFPIAARTVRVRIDTNHPDIGIPIPRPKFWAFLTVTNNETQHITVISPQ